MKRIILLLSLALSIILVGCVSPQQQIAQKEQDHEQKRVEQKYLESMHLGLYLMHTCGNQVKHIAIQNDDQYCQYSVYQEEHNVYHIENNKNEYLTIYQQGDEYQVKTNMNGEDEWAIVDISTDNILRLDEMLNDICEKATIGSQVFVHHDSYDVISDRGNVVCYYSIDGNEPMECRFSSDMKVEIMRWQDAEQNKKYEFRFMYGGDMKDETPDDVSAHIDVDSVLGLYDIIESVFE